MNLAWAGRSMSFPSNNKAYQWGAGINVGTMTSLVVKRWTGSDRAMDFGLALSSQDYLLLYSDFLHHYRGYFGRRDSFLTHLYPYMGVGGILTVMSKNSENDQTFYPKKSGGIGLALRAPIGLEWTAPEMPMSTFIEGVPGISIMPKMEFFLQIGLGLRYLF